MTVENVSDKEDTNDDEAKASANVMEILTRETEVVKELASTE